MQTQPLLPLVDYLAYMTHCEYVSDLHFMDDVQKWKAHRALKRVPVEAYPLREWNDALCYVTLHAPQDTASEARTELMEFLGQQEKTPDDDAPAGGRHGLETNAHKTQRRPLRSSFLRVCLSSLGMVSR